jgi:hypothetical protein
LKQQPTTVLITSGNHRRNHEEEEERMKKQSKQVQKHYRRMRYGGRKNMNISMNTCVDLLIINYFRFLSNRIFTIINSSKSSQAAAS